MARPALLWFALAVCSPAALAVPTGMSPYIYGVHDEPEAGFFPSEESCSRGWVTTLRYIGAGGSCGAGDIDMSGLADQGIGVIMRLDYGEPAQPPNAADWDGFAAAFADCVARSSGIRVWVVGNEPNLPWGHPEDRPFTPAEYGEIYRRVVAAVDAIEGGAEHEILFAAMAPWAALAPWGDWDDGFAAALDHVSQNNGHIDGVAVHAYTYEAHEPGAISSEAWFPGREGKWHLHFRLYRDALGILSARGLTQIPLYITEAGNACNPPCDPYQDADNGYFQAMYEEIHTWNQDHPDQVVRAVTPYRWTSNDDGSGRDFCIGCSNGMRADLSAAMAVGRRWSDTECHTELPSPQDAGAINDGGAGDQATSHDTAAVPDGATDASVPDRGTDAQVERDSGSSGLEDGSAADNSGPSSGIGEGCGCTAVGYSPATSPLLPVLVLLGAARRRSRSVLPSRSGR